jgi:hypothetical protein
MSESTEAVLVEEVDPDREEAWLQAICNIHIALFGCIDDGPTPEALELALDLSRQLAAAVVLEREVNQGSSK